MRTARRKSIHSPVRLPIALACVLTISAHLMLSALLSLVMGSLLPELARYVAPQEMIRWSEAGWTRATEETKIYMLLGLLVWFGYSISWIDCFGTDSNARNRL